MDRQIRVTTGAPAPFRAGSAWAEAWSGVLTASDWPCRPVIVPWPNGHFHTGRVQLVQHIINQLPLLQANVYGFATGNTFRDLRAATDDLLRTVTQELVIGRHGPRVITGDLNHGQEDLEQVQIWRELGWVEAQQLAWDRWGRVPVPTCKGSTQRDYIFLSPETASLATQVQVWDIFQEHSTVVVYLAVEDSVHKSLQWPLPREIPWTAVSCDSWHGAPHAPDVPGGRLPNGCHGRGKRCKPSVRELPVVGLSKSRPGEEFPHHELLSLEVKRWFQQLRRLQSACHALRNCKPQPDAIAYRVDLWRSILGPKGFQAGFAAWWPTRQVRHVGCPSSFPALLPGYEVCRCLFLDFRDNFRRFEAWHVRQRTHVLQASYQRVSDVLVRDLRTDQPEQVDSLVLRNSYQVMRVDPSSGRVEVEVDLDTRGISDWTLNGQSVRLCRGHLCPFPSSLVGACHP